MNFSKTRTRKPTQGGMLSLTTADGVRRRHDAEFVSDAVDDRRRNDAKRDAVEATLRSIDDADEREAYLRIIRGLPSEARVH